MITVLLVDDERMVCAHLRTILTAAEDISVVGEAYDGAEAVEAVIRLRPHVVLLDLRMPGVEGLTAIERIAELGVPSRVVALTTFDVDSYVLRALRAGAAGFLLKSTAPEDISSAWSGLPRTGTRCCPPPPPGGCLPPRQSRTRNAVVPAG
ncbi:MAG: response regulator [Geodermatophilaceae bacterium]